MCFSCSVTRFLPLRAASQEVAKTGRLPVVNFAAGGIATPADAALMMQLGVDGEAPVIAQFDDAVDVNS